MQAQIKQFDSSLEFYTAEKCYITELSNTLEDPDLSIARARVAPGITTSWHRLRDTIERYVILEGSGLMEVGSLAAQQLKPGDVVLIPAMCRQRIANNGNQDLIFLAICTPRFAPEVYENIEHNSSETCK